MENVKQIFITVTLLIFPHFSSTLQCSNGIARVHYFFNTFVWVTLIVLASLNPTIVNAAPPAHANQHANNVAGGEVLPEHMQSGHGGNAEWAKGRILVMPRAGLPAQAFAHILEEHGGKARKIGQSDLYIVDLPEYTEEGVIARLAHHPHLKFAELDHLVSPSLTPNDPYYANGWHLPKISSPTAWDNSQGTGVTIAILDSGVDSSHPDLAAKMVSGWNFYDNNSNTADVYGHGTKVAGAAAAITNNGSGVAGVAGQSKIMPIRVTDTSGLGYYSMIAEGLTYAADHGARVANASFRGLPDSLTVQNSAQYMKNKGGLVVVSGGNTGVLENYAVTTTMIPVAATDTNDSRTSWSSYGNYIMLAAPGAGIWTTTNGGGYGSVSGTSFASPITAGVIALMMSANTGMKNTDVEKSLFSTAVDLGTAGWDQYYGYGRVNAAAAVQAAIASVVTADSTAPAVAIIDPLAGATVADLVPVDIEAIDNVGVTRTELWVNNTSVAVDTTSPFAFTWDSKGVANGTANLVVRAFDAAGNVANSSAVSVTVNNTIPVVTNDTEPPAVQIVNPVAGNVSGSITITANASDNSGAAGIGLSIYVDGALKAIGTGSTLSVSWSTRSRNVKAGSHTIQAVAKDAAGNTSSTSVTVNVVK